ncbi:MAG: zinc ribbon domain-containing protein [Planctomycetota bacterium]|jgi:ribosomal protein S27E
MERENESKTKRRKRIDALFGRIAMHLQIVNQRQVHQALEIQGQANEQRPLGLILMDLGYVSQKDLERILEKQRQLVQEAAMRAKAVKEDNLFGKVAISMQYCTEEQLQESIAHQERLPHGRFMRLGEIMVSKGYLSKDHVDKVLEVQKGLIVYCPNCGTQYNVVMFRPGSSLQCYRCGSPMVVPSRLTPEGLDEALFLPD